MSKRNVSDILRARGILGVIRMSVTGYKKTPQKHASFPSLFPVGKQEMEESRPRSLELPSGPANLQKPLAHLPSSCSRDYGSSIIFLFSFFAGGFPPPSSGAHAHPEQFAAGAPRLLATMHRGDCATPGSF